MEEERRAACSGQGPDPGPRTRRGGDGENGREMGEEEREDASRGRYDAGFPSF